MRRLLLSLVVCAAPAFARQQEEINYCTYPTCDATTKALVQKVMTGLGGEANLRTIQSVRKKATIQEQTPDGPLKTEFDGVALFPDSLYARIDATKGSLTAVTTKNAAFVYPANAIAKGAALKLNENEKTTFNRYFYEEPFLVLKNRIDPSYLFALGPRSKVNGRDADLLYVHVNGFAIEWFVDAENGRVIRAKTGKKIIDFSDWRQVGNLTLPFLAKSSIDGRVSTMLSRQYQINPPVEASLFATPTLWMTRRPLGDRSQRRGWYGSYDGHASSSYDRSYDYSDSYSAYDSVSSYVSVLYVEYW